MCIYRDNTVKTFLKGMNSPIYHESSAWSLAVSFVQIHLGGGRLMLFSGKWGALLLLVPGSLTRDKGLLIL